MAARLKYAEKGGEGGVNEGAQRSALFLILELILAREDAQRK